MTKKYYDPDERGYPAELDNRFYRGVPPHLKAPHNLHDIVFLIARLMMPPFEDDLSVIYSYYNTESGKITCRKCALKRQELADILRHLRSEYAYLQKHTAVGIRPFTTKEVIALVSIITMRLTLRKRLARIIQAFYDKDGNYKEICALYNIPQRTYYHYLNQYIKKPYLDFYRCRKN